MVVLRALVDTLVLELEQRMEESMLHLWVPNLAAESLVRAALDYERYCLTQSGYSSCK